jgi:hypothetical protein
MTAPLTEPKFRPIPKAPGHLAFAATDWIAAQARAATMFPGGYVELHCTDRGQWSAAPKAAP